MAKVDLFYFIISMTAGVHQRQTRGGYAQGCLEQVCCSYHCCDRYLSYKPLNPNISMYILHIDWKQSLFCSKICGANARCERQSCELLVLWAVPLAYHIIHSMDFRAKERLLRVHSPHRSPYTFYGNDEENLLNDQDLCYLLIMSFFLTSLCWIGQCYYKEKLNIGLVTLWGSRVNYVHGNFLCYLFSCNDWYFQDIGSCSLKLKTKKHVHNKVLLLLKLAEQQSHSKKL